MNDDTDPLDDRPSKSQKKREMESLRKLAARLTELSKDQLDGIDDLQIREAVEAARKITKGNARKRQIAYTAKLMSKINIEPIKKTVDELDASSDAYVRKFHQLETWREQLISGDRAVLSEIFDTYPDADRQQLVQLTRSAIREHELGQQGTHFRKLFQFLKALE